MKFYQKIVTGGLVLASLTGLIGCCEPSKTKIKTKVQQRYVQMNSDDLKDILVVKASGNDDCWKKKEYRAHQAIISLSQPDGTYKDQIISYNEQPLEVMVEDMNGDERKDVLAIVASSCDDCWKTQDYRKFDLVVSYQNEDGSFALPKVLKTFDQRPD